MIDKLSGATLLLRLVTVSSHFLSSARTGYPLAKLGTRRGWISALTLARALSPEKPGSLLGTREKFKFRQFPTRRRDGKLSFAPPCIGFITLGGWRENARATELVCLRSPKITMSDLSEILRSLCVRETRARGSERSVPARSLNSRSRPHTCWRVESTSDIRRCNVSLFHAFTITRENVTPQCSPRRGKIDLFR